MANVRIMPRTTVFGSYDHGAFGAVERVNEHVAMPPEFEPRQRLWRSSAAVRGRSRRDRAPAALRRQRPARRDAGGRRARLRQPLRGACRPAGRRVTDNDDAWTPRRISPQPARRSPRSSIRARTPRPSAGAGVPSPPGHVVRALGGRGARGGRDRATARGPRARRLRPACDIRRLDADACT